MRLQGGIFDGPDTLLDDKGEPTVCEVNSHALINAAERVTGEKVAGIFAEYMVKKVINS